MKIFKSGDMVKSITNDEFFKICMNVSSVDNQSYLAIHLPIGLTKNAGTYLLTLRKPQNYKLVTDAEKKWIEVLYGTIKINYRG